MSARCRGRYSRKRLRAARPLKVAPDPATAPVHGGRRAHVRRSRCGDTVITRQQIRAVLADGGQVVDPTGQQVGRIVDVVLGYRTSQPAWVTVDCRLCDAEAFVPLGRARLLEGCVEVPYTAAEVCGAPRADRPAGRLDERQWEELGRFYADLDDGMPVGSGPLVTPTNGSRRTNGAALARHSLDAELDVLPVSPGLAVRAGNDSPAAYPATSTRPWLPVSTSAPGPSWWERRQWRWPSVPSSIRAMRLELAPVLDLAGLPREEVDDLVLAAGEAASNAVEHAESPVLPFFDVLTEVGAERARIVVQDHGRWRAPTFEGERGRGLQMIGVLADATLTVGTRGTTVVLHNHRGPAE